jgi:hypothetical protein
MFCVHDGNKMNKTYVDVEHRLGTTTKTYHNITQFKCMCGYSSIPYSMYEFMDEHIDDDTQIATHNLID